MSITSSQPTALYKAPLRLEILFHPQSDKARDHAQGLFRRFMATDLVPGLRIAVAFHPERDDFMPGEPALEAAQHTLVVALVDSRMSRRARESDRPCADAWANEVVRARALLHQHERHGMLLVALDDGAFGLDGARLGEASFIRLDVSKDQANDLAFQVAVGSLRLLRQQRLSEGSESEAPVQIFVSHSKSDLPSASNEVVEGPVLELLAWLAKGPVASWYDATKIRSGDAFAKSIAEGIARSEAFVCVLTDHWSEREWCRRELLIAKRAGKPVVVVDALASVVPRLFSYIGNARTLRWEPSKPQAVALAVVLEALRHLHTKAVLEQHKLQGDFVLGTLPEALTLRSLPPGTTSILHPDPPLPLEELAEVSPVHVFGDDGKLANQVEVTTPLQRLASWRRPEGADLVGLSLSGATDIWAWGASPDHLAVFADDLATLLLVAGLRIGYGGVLAHGGSTTDAISYTTRLFSLVRSYSPHAQGLGASRIHPIENFSPWPIYLGYGDKDLSLYGQEAVLVEAPAPPGIDLKELNAGPKERFPFDTPAQRWAAAMGTTAMRELMNARICCRVAVAGKLDSFGGTIPGVIEEILLARGKAPNEPASATTSPAKHPLFLIGAFGGATRLAIEHLRQAQVQDVPGNAVVLSEFQRRALSSWTPLTATAALRSLGQNGVAEALGNGLSDAENEELFFSTDTYRLVELVLTGLRRTFAPE